MKNDVNGQMDLLDLLGIEKEVDVLLMHEKNDMSKYFAPNRGTAL